MIPANDPKTYFAAERTLLSWVNSGLAVMGFGFVIARFGLFLRLVEHHHEPRHHTLSTALGIALVLLGVSTTITAAVQHLRFLRTLGPGDRPPHYWMGMAPSFAFAQAVVGLTMAICLIFWTG
jgi:putative membrane protein